MALGAPHPYIADMSAWEASFLIDIGDWRGCEAALRMALGGRPSVHADARARLLAALLAARQGRPQEAAAHLARALELVPDRSSFIMLPFDSIRIELDLAAGRTDDALAGAMACLNKPEPPLDAELYLPLAARALADQAADLRDRRADPAPVLERLADLRRVHPAVIVPDVESNDYYRAYIRAVQHLADAETARGFDSPDQAAAWQRASEACHASTLLWYEAYGRWREAQAQLRDRSTRRAGTDALREAYRLATDLRAGPLLSELTALATGARVSLNGDGQPAEQDYGLPGLTPREREILGHVVAGRSYAEIAQALVLSQKTVGVHISNMLRKTGTANRVELAQLARRVAS
jgi:DNA-binding CsgD family transcriptional regulator